MTRPTVLVYHADPRYAELMLPAEHLSVAGASHWGLVLSRRALRTLVADVVRWLGGVATA